MVSNKDVIKVLENLKEEIELSIESLELMSDKKLMKSLAESKEQIRKGELVSWDELQDIVNS